MKRVLCSSEASRESSIRIFISKEVISHITDGAIQSIVRNALFSGSSKIDWEVVLKSALANMPELYNVLDQYGLGQ